MLEIHSVRLECSAEFRLFFLRKLCDVNRHTVKISEHCVHSAVLKSDKHLNIFANYALRQVQSCRSRKLVQNNIAIINPASIELQTSQIEPAARADGSSRLAIRQILADTCCCTSGRPQKLVTDVVEVLGNYGSKFQLASIGAREPRNPIPLLSGHLRCHQLRTC